MKNVYKNKICIEYIMSQSDYIRCKRIERQLKELAESNEYPKKVQPVLDSGKYILYKEYSLENRNAYDRSESNKIDDPIQPSLPVIYGLPKQCLKYKNTFAICCNTELRPHRNTPIGGYAVGFRNERWNTIPKEQRMKWNDKLNKSVYTIVCEKCERLQRVV